MAAPWPTIVTFADQDAGNQARFGDIDNYTEWRRLRLQSDGEGYGVYFYRVQVEFEPEGVAGVADSGVIIRDCYIGMKEVPWLGTVIIGNTKQPISLEVLTSSNYLTFMERSLPRMFLVDERRLGIHAANYIPSEALIWDYGIFVADPFEEDHEVISDNPGVRLVGRTVTTPYFCEGGRHFVHLGLGGAWQTVGEDNLWRWRTRPEVHEGPNFIDSGLFDSRSFYTLNFESAVNWGTVSLQSELYYNRNDSMLGDIDLYGAYAEATWFLTGESRPYERSRGIFERVKPYTNFWLVRGSDGVDMGWGAWQLATRWSTVDLSDAAFRGRDRGIQTRPDGRHQLVLEPEHSLAIELDPHLELVRPGRPRVHRRSGRHRRRAGPTGFLTDVVVTPILTECGRAGWPPPLRWLKNRLAGESLS